ncbi:hypothetical protein TMEC54S_01012 [Thauera mechernichensis]
MRRTPPVRHSAGPLQPAAAPGCDDTEKDAGDGGTEHAERGQPQGQLPGMGETGDHAAAQVIDTQSVLLLMIIDIDIDCSQ